MQMDVKELGLFELKLNLFSREYNGIPYWQIIRLKVYESIFSQRIERMEYEKEKRGGKFLYLLKGIKYAVYSRMAIKNIKPCEVICFKADKNKDKFYDYWRMPREISSIYIRGGNNVNELDCHDKINIIEPYIKANVIYRLKKVLRLTKIDYKERAFLKEVEKELANRYGRCVSAEYMEDQILRYIEYQKYYKPFFEKLFKKTKCKAIMVVWYYQTPMMIAYQIAKKMGIKIIELQHGVINNHEEYWFEDQRGLNNYTPDYFLAYGELHIRWTKMLPSTCCIPVGYPFQEKEICRLKTMSTEDKTIIIYPEAQESFELVINEFANLAASEGYRIIMKLHPLQSKMYEIYYPILSQNKNIEIICDQSKGIYYWLKTGKFHVMANTTVGFEALAFSHTIICIAENVNHEQVQPLLDWKLAQGFKASQELLDIIHNPKQRNEFDRIGLWQTGSEKNIGGFMESLKNQGYRNASNFDFEKL